MQTSIYQVMQDNSKVEVTKMVKRKARKINKVRKIKNKYAIKIGNKTYSKGNGLTKTQALKMKKDFPLVLGKARIVRHSIKKKNVTYFKGGHSY